jgi:hypothetical protein
MIFLCIVSVNSLKKYFMKKILLGAAILGVLFTTTSSTCSPDVPEPTLKDYTCKCTYVGATGSPSDSLPDKEETTTVKAEDNSGGQFECAKLEGKYITQYFDGTCLLQ